MSDTDAPASPFRVSLALRWRDMDMLGHLNQAVYHELLEDARGAFIVSLFGAFEQHQAFVLARVELDYRREVRMDHHHLDIEVRVDRIGTKSLTLAHDILLPDGSVAASGISILVGWDGRSRGPRELGDDERARLRAA